MVVRRSPIEAAHAALGARWVGADSMWPADYGDPAREAAAAHASAGVAEVGGTRNWTLRGSATSSALSKAGLPFQPGFVSPESLAEAGQVWGLAPDEALLVGFDASKLPALDGPRSSLVDVSAGLVMLRLGGPNSPRILAQLCAIDLDPGVFADGQLAQAAMAGVRVTLARIDRGGMAAYDIVVVRDYAAYLWDSLVHSGGRRHNLAPVGPGAFGAPSATRSEPPGTKR